MAKIRIILCKSARTSKETGSGIDGPRSAPDSKVAGVRLYYSQTNMFVAASTSWEAAKNDRGRRMTAAYIGGM
jgi:hypothetical protein